MLGIGARRILQNRVQFPDSLAVLSGVGRMLEL
jgi:hypothetical protein